MNAYTLTPHERIYKNNGQQAEIDLAYTLTGETRKADNRKGGADVGIYQVKSFRATVCKGESLENILSEYAEAERFAFVDRDEKTWYDLSKTEFLEFAQRFAQATTESKLNGGGKKFRLNQQFRQQREWLRSKS